MRSNIVELQVLISSQLNIKQNNDTEICVSGGKVINLTVLPPEIFQVKCQN